MTTCCSFCKRSGHNIRSCSDPRIWQLWQTLVVNFLIPKIGSEFTIQDRWTIIGFLDCEYPEDVVRATAYQLTKKNHGTASYVQHHYRTDLVNHLIFQLEHASALPADMLDEWIGMFKRDPTHIEDPVIEDPVIEDQDPDSIIWIEDTNGAEQTFDDIDSITWFEDRTPTPIPVEPSFPIIEATMLCLETQEELGKLIECVICQEDKPLLDCNTTNCGHSFCHGCITKHIESKGKQRPPCPLCRTPITSLEIKDIENFEKINHNFGRAASILKDCLNRVLGYQTPPSFWGTHFELISFIISELDIIQYDEQLSHSVYSQDTNLERAETLWRYMSIKGIDNECDISYEEFVQGMNTAMRNLENMPDII